ncbi:MAG: hypothetical protein EOO54_29070 [Haliea sp.]|nr:MAG: hypothetical protein EOO54_29070 [Haliea sp.]
MTALIDDLLHFARTARSGIEMLPADLSVLVRDCLETFQEEIARRGVQVTVEPLPVCRLDRPLMAQVLLNLVGNALKYTGEQARPVVKIGTRPDATEVVVYVQDNGVGFEMEFVSKLFRPFERLHPASQFKGSGIGLALVRQVIERHGGRVWAEATPGQGACFYFALPRSDDSVGPGG